MSNDTELGKYIALILRHKPETIEASLDEHGWMEVDTLINGINSHSNHHIDMERLERIVKEDNKGRYSFGEDKLLIRANQGHSVSVDVEMPEMTPPDILYHGTGEKFVASIDEQGLIPKSRLYVHLSKDIETASKVGSRHGHPVIYEVMSGKMAADGYKFYLSANGVWQTKSVPTQYLKKIQK